MLAQETPTGIRQVVIAVWKREANSGFGCNHPRLMRELVLATIAGQPDIEVVGKAVGENELVDAIEESQPDVLILTLDTAEKRIAQCGFLLGGGRKCAS